MLLKSKALCTNKRSIGNASKTAIGSVEIMVGTVGTVIFSVVGIPLLVHGSQTLLKGIRGKYIMHSMINNESLSGKVEE